METLLLDQDGPILTLTLNQPAKLNPLDLAQWDELGHALSHAGEHDTIRAVVITGAGRAFSAGADIRGMGARRDPADQIARLNRINPVIQQLAELPKPTIAALNGVAAGIGASLALACDLIVAEQQASLVCSWVKIGLAPDCGASWRLTHLVGAHRAKELILTARPLPAEEALSWGLVNQVVAEGQALAHAQELARSIASYSPHALGYAKSLADAAATTTLAEQLAAEIQAQSHCITTSEFQAAVAAFLERRAKR